MPPRPHKRRRLEFDSEPILQPSEDMMFFEEHDIIITKNNKTKLTQKVTAIRNPMSTPGPSSLLPAVREDNQEPRDNSSSLPVPPKHKTASQLLGDFGAVIPTLVQALIALETPLLHHAVPPCMRCSSSPGCFQCLECHLSPLLCESCIVNAHTYNPFHTIDQFITEPTVGLVYRRKADLFNLGLVVHLGHCGDPCPSPGTPSDIKTMIIVHTNGIHKTRLRYCACTSNSPVYQLMISRLFPATTERPQTVFTHQVLQHFCQHTHEAGTTPYAYFAAIKRLTDNVTWDNVEDRYREFLRAGRVWRHLQDILCSGEFVGLNECMPLGYQTSYAIECPACPQPHINMSPKYREEVLAKPHKHKFFAAIDGNFRQVLTRKPYDSGDFALSDGKAFFVAEEKYQAYLQSVQDSPELSTCTGFKAGDVLRQHRIRGLVVTGIVAVSCSRHNMICPQGIVDLYHGERYSNVDYAVTSTLRQYQNTSIPIELAYDIACKYSINFNRRMNQNFPHMVPLLEQITFLVPAMHVKAHELKCQKKYMRDFAPATGKCDAEGGERIWSELNQWAASTSEMNPGHRHDIINDNVNDWNWRKLVGIGSYLVDRWLLACKQRRRCKWEFDEFTASTSERLITHWKTLSTTPVESSDRKSVSSVFFPDDKKVPSQAEIRLAILEEEKQRQGSSEHIPVQSKVALHDALVFALDLEQLQANTISMQEVYTNVPTDANAVTLHSMRTSVETKLKLWCQYQSLHIPAISNSHSESLQLSETPETVTLGLPSDLLPRERTSTELHTASILERRLRETYAYSTINELKHNLALRAANHNARRKHVVGQKDSTRSYKHSLSLTATIKYNIATYERHRVAMINLGLSKDDTTFQPLKMEHCTLTGLVQEEGLSSKQQGKKKDLKEVSWIWRMGYSLQPGQQMTDWDVEFRRTQWFILRARKDRWHEEVEILEEEMRRVVRFFRFWDKVWCKFAIEKVSKGQIEGIGSYAMRMAIMYRTLSENVQHKFSKEILEENEPIMQIGADVEDEGDSMIPFEI